MEPDSSTTGNCRTHRSSIEGSDRSASNLEWNREISSDGSARESAGTSSRT
jgi:hypothetical protein